MNITALQFGFSFGVLAIILGAFGAHLLKKYMSEETLKSFETGVRYQMYHALLLVLIGYQIPDVSNATVYTLVTGVLLFSFSIYGLCFTSTFGKKWKFLGPITPIGGLFLVAGWIMLLIKTIS